MVALCFATLLPLSTSQDRYPDLRAYVDRDLRRLVGTERESLDRIMAKLAPPAKPFTKDGIDYLVSKFPKPWWLTRFRTATGEWLLANIDDGPDVPDQGYVRLFLFDRNWKLVGKTDFYTGYRLRIQAADLVRQTPYKTALLRIDVSSTGPFAETRKGLKPLFDPASGIREWYAIDKGEALLIRCTDGKGHYLTNSYCGSAADLGPNVSGRNAREWQADLRSTEPFRQLRCLVWLSGRHLPSRLPRAAGVSQESKTDSETFETVRTASWTKARLVELSHSGDAWVRETASTILAQPER